MKTLFALFIVSVSLGLSGCSTAQISKIPNASFGSWTHDGNYGVFSTHVEAHDASKSPDGTIHINAYTGSLKVMGGFGPSDTITDLIILPGAAPEPLAVVPQAK